MSSEDIRSVSRLTPFAPLKRGSRSGEHKSNSEGGSGGWAEEESAEGVPAGEQSPSQAALEALERDVEGANGRLQAAGKQVRLRLQSAAAGPFIEIILPGEGGAAVVTRRIAPDEIASWLERLEKGEGLVIDERL